VLKPTVKSAIKLGGIEVRFLLDEVDTNGRATVFETVVPAGAFTPPPHSHDGFEETVYVLKGGFKFTLDGTACELSAEEALLIERGAVHGFDSLGSAGGSFLSVATPGVFGPAYFHEIAEVLATGSPPDLGAIFAVMARHGLTPARPA
jgi:quercetin dioxygenase-like cupin family protein